MKQKIRKETEKEIRKNEEELIKEDRIGIAKNLLAMNMNLENAQVL